MLKDRNRNRNMKNNKMRKRKWNIKKIKRIAIVGVPIVILCIISYVSISLRSQAHGTTSVYEHYYDGDEYSNSEEEYNDTESNTQGEDAVVIDYNDETEDEIVITNHDSVVLDTDPESMTVMVNKELSLPSDYIPEDLVVPNVLFEISYFDEKKQMRAEAATALEKLFQAAQNENVILYAISGYRSYQRQYDIFTANIRKQGLAHTMQYSAKPGYSEHQTGLAIDLSSKSMNNRLDDAFADTLEGKWLADNAYLFGYIIRYPEGKSDITGYSYEPWHIRYVGKPLAKYIYENDLTLEEYYNYEPNIDYANEISYDNLESYGIDLKDVLAPVVKSTADEEPVKSSNTADDANTAEEADTQEEQSTDSTQSLDIEEVNPDTEDAEGSNSENTEEATNSDTKTPTKAPTKTPTPTKTPAPTKIPEPTIIPTPTVIPNSSEEDSDDPIQGEQSLEEPTTDDSN